MKIVLALDDSQHSERALDFVARMRWPAGSTLMVLSVLPPNAAGFGAPYEPVGLALEPIEAQHARLRDGVARAERTLREHGLSAAGQVIDGDPREVLIDTAERERADLLVVGSHGRTGLAKLTLGSVSSHVVTHAPCSVLVVKGPRPTHRLNPPGGSS